MPLQAPAKIGNMKPEKKDKKKTGNGDMCSRTNSTMKCRAEGAEDNLARSSQVGRGGWPPFTGAEVFSETLGGGGGSGCAPNALHYSPPPRPRSASLAPASAR